jgi:hypothetical protein
MLSLPGKYACCILFVPQLDEAAGFLEPGRVDEDKWFGFTMACSY